LDYNIEENERWEDEIMRDRWGDLAMGRGGYWRGWNCTFVSGLRRFRVPELEEAIGR
jgi:hypothetical protein